MLARVATATLLLLWATCAWAADGIANVSAFPTVAVADGRSTITVTVEVRDGNGRLVPDGTQVVLESTLGNFREPAVNTQNGFARATLVAGTTPGLAKITVSVLAFRAFTKLDFEFVKDKSELSSATEFFEISCARYLAYFPARKIIAAAAPKRGARVRLRSMIVESDDIQLNVPSYTVRTRKARLTLDKTSYEFEQLSFDFRAKKGVGLALYDLTLPDGTKASKLGPVEVDLVGMRPIETSPDPSILQFEDLSSEQAQVTAKRIIVIPSRELQFQRADVFINSNRILRVPLYQMSINSSVPTVGDQFLEVSNNRPAVNYPYYLSLRPGFSSLARFRYGQRFVSGVGAAGGTLVDFESTWSKGDDFQGAATFTGAGRKDWGLSTRQFVRFNDKTSSTIQLDFPANSALFGSVNATRLLPGWSLNYSGNAGRNTKGANFRSQSHFVTLEKDPIPLGKLPIRMFNGLTAQRSTYKSDFTNSAQTGYGLRSRLQTNVLPLSKRTNLSASFAISALSGKNVPRGLTTSGLLSLWSQIARGFSTSINYDFLDDPISSSFVGRHRVTTSTNFSRGNLDMSLYGSKSLDVDRVSGSADVSYRMSPLWRLSSIYTVDRFRGSSFNDYSFVIGYNLGIREIGLSWSNRTRRIGFELLGTSLR